MNTSLQKDSSPSTHAKSRENVVIELHPEHYIVVRDSEGPICQIAINKDGPIISLPVQSHDRISLDDKPIKAGEIPLLVDVTRLYDCDTNTLVEPGEPVGLPVWRRERLGDPSAPLSLAAYGDPADPIRRGESDPVVTDIIISYVTEPNQTKKRTAQITHELAAKHNMAVMSIAGIRANLKRGVYGDMDMMIQAETKVRVKR